ncbi:MAG: AAA family ATPase [Rhodobacteraceae bacterium]|nr:AAA family ATPase [Paracoccaceae bacterium]
MKIVDLTKERSEREKAEGICITQSVERMENAIGLVRSFDYTEIRRTATDNIAITGPAGCGKTTFLRSYAHRNKDAIYFQVKDRKATFPRFMRKIAAAIDPDMVPYGIRNYSIFYALNNGGLLRNTDSVMVSDALFEFFKATRCTLIVDEAQNVRPDTLDALRQIADHSGAPMVFAGNETLYEQIGPGKRLPEQFSSRIGAFVNVTVPDMQDDAEQLARYLGVKDKDAIEYLGMKARTCGGLRFVARLMAAFAKAYGSALPPALADMKDMAALLGFPE